MDVMSVAASTPGIGLMASDGAPSAGPLGTLLSGTFGIRRQSRGGDASVAAEVFENSKVRITVPVRDDGAALSELVFGTYSYEVLDDGTERIACGGREFTVCKKFKKLV